jgi:VIT1/CCC1 family predicted Fe2+/Mn2+ transporter
LTEIQMAQAYIWIMADDERAIASEERIIYVAMILAVLPVLVAALARGGPIGGGTSLCIAIAALGIVGLASRTIRRRRVPRATARMR